LNLKPILLIRNLVSVVTLWRRFACTF